MLPTLTPSQGLKIFFFTMNFFAQHRLYVNNMHDKFKGQKIKEKKDIQNLPTCVVVKKFHYCPL